MRIRITRQANAKSPGSDGASPYLSALPVYDDVTPYEISRSNRPGSMGVRITRQDDAKSPGGRAKLRLSRGFPGCLACDVTPL
jgi:hypothetical protein